VVKAEVDASGKWDKKVVTEIVKARPFYPAEDYHQDYLQRIPAATPATTARLTGHVVILVKTRVHGLPVLGEEVGQDCVAWSVVAQGHAIAEGVGIEDVMLPQLVAVEDVAQTFACGQGGASRSRRAGGATVPRLRSRCGQRLDRAGRAHR